MAVGIDVDRPGAQRLLFQCHGIIIAIVVAQRRSPASGMNAVGDGRAQILAESRREAQSLQRRKSAHWRDYRLWRRRLEHFHDAGGGRDPLLGWGFGRRWWLEILDVPPSVAFRPLAAAAARTLRVSERQPHLEREIGAQEVGKIGAVGANHHPHRVFAQTQMVEQDIARSIAQHLMQRLPGQRGIERRVKELLDPGRIEVFGLAVPGIAQRPEAPLGPLRPRRLGGAHGDFARDRAALARRKLGVPRAGGRRGDLGEPEIGRPTMPVARLGRDASVGRDQRKLALERLLHGEYDAQRRALPRHDRRRQDRELGRVFAAADLTLSLSLRVRDREKEDETCARDQQDCCHSRSS